MEIHIQHIELFCGIIFPCLADIVPLGIILDHIKLSFSLNVSCSFALSLSGSLLLSAQLNIKSDECTDFTYFMLKKKRIFAYITTTNQ